MWKESTSPTPKFHVTNSLSDLLALDTMHCIRLLPPPQLVNIRAYPLSSGNPPLRTLSGVPNDISPSWFALWIVIHTEINSINGIQPNSTAREMGEDIPPQYICSSSDCWQAPHTSVSLEEIPFRHYVMRSLNWVPSRILGSTICNRPYNNSPRPASLNHTIINWLNDAIDMPPTFLIDQTLLKYASGQFFQHCVDRMLSNMVAEASKSLIPNAQTNYTTSSQLCDRSSCWLLLRFSWSCCALEV